MVKLSRAIVLYMAGEEGPGGIMRRLSDPYWFQALGCVLGFDWHSSGVTTTVCAALKEALRGIDQEVGLFAAGGKGGTSRRAPREILDAGDRILTDLQPVVYASRMAAKVDSAAVQDGYQLYHHTIFFTPQGQWAVVQQGMNPATRLARRYHWLSTAVQDFVCEPHAAICCDARGEALNLVAQESALARTVAVELARQSPERTLAEMMRVGSLTLPSRHQVLLADIDPRRIRSILLSTYERQPEDFATLLSLPGVGPATLRALSLISELVYGAPPSFRDPARFSFAHGGKDGHPYPVDREGYDRSIQILRLAVQQAKLGQRETSEAIYRLMAFAEGGAPIHRPLSPLLPNTTPPRRAARQLPLPF
jgi:hypothetical protein